LTIDVGELRCFVVLAEELHFGRASQRLAYTRSHVSQILQRLERELGVTLFERSTRRVVLTREGALLLEHARTVVDAIVELEDHARALTDQLLSEFRVVYAPGTGLTTIDLLRQLAIEAPDVAVRIDPSPTSLGVIQTIAGGEARVGIAQWTTPHLESLVLPSAPVCLYVWTGHRLASKASVTIADLDHEPLLVAERGVNPDLYDAVVAYCRGAGVEPEFLERHIPSPSQLIELVANEQGLAFNRQMPPVPGTVSVPMEGPLPPGHTVFLLWRKQAVDRLTRILIKIGRNLQPPAGT
jgi:DNA-binding transcriptional LysR family regulator